jgi:hypothetical protein
VDGTHLLLLLSSEPYLEGGIWVDSHWLYENRKNDKFRLKKIAALCHDFLGEYTGRIEVCQQKQRSLVYFQRPPYKKFLDKNDKVAFYEELDRETHKTRADSMIRNAPGLLNTISTKYTVYNKQFFPIRLLHKYKSWIEIICFLLVFACNTRRPWL